MNSIHRTVPYNTHNICCLMAQAQPSTVLWADWIPVQAKCIALPFKNKHHNRKDLSQVLQLWSPPDVSANHDVKSRDRLLVRVVGPNVSSSYPISRRPDNLKKHGHNTDVSTIRWELTYSMELFHLSFIRTKICPSLFPFSIPDREGDLGARGSH